MDHSFRLSSNCSRRRHRERPAGVGGGESFNGKPASWPGKGSRPNVAISLRRDEPLIFCVQHPMPAAMCHSLSLWRRPDQATRGSTSLSRRSETATLAGSWRALELIRRGISVALLAVGLSVNLADVVDLPPTLKVSCLA